MTVEGARVSSRPVWEFLAEFVRVKVQAFVQAMLEEEVSDLLGRGQSVRRHGVDTPVGYRNGYWTPRRLA
jgi:hypothetical protein